MSFKYGRRAPVHDRRTMRLALALHPALAALGSPPTASDDYVSAVEKQSPNGWQMFLNNELGDCTAADTAHQVMLHSANGGSIVIPTDDDVLSFYEATGGYVPGSPSTDNGADEMTVCRYLQSTGMAGVKSAATAPVDPTNADHIKWTVQIFGACRLGIMVTDAMMSDFSAGRPWTSMTGSIDGGHDVPIVKYDPSFAYVVTWGRLQPVAWSLLVNSDFLQECHCDVFADFVKAGGTAPNGFDLNGMLAALAQVEMQQAA